MAATVVIEETAMSAKVSFQRPTVHALTLASLFMSLRREAEVLRAHSERFQRRPSPFLLP